MTKSNHTDLPDYKGFFDIIWGAYCEKRLNYEDSDFIIKTAVKNNLAKEEDYDPEIHGDVMGIEWDMEKGDPCYVLNKEGIVLIVHRLNNWDALVESLKAMIKSVEFFTQDHMYPEAMYINILQNAKTAIKKVAAK